MSVLTEKLRLDGKVALVTGATRGLGFAIAEAFAEAGARLIVSSRTANPAALDRLRSHGVEVDYVQADMEDPEAPGELVREAVRLAGRLDILVNNAGIADHGDTHDFSDERFRRSMTVNFDSVFRSCRAALGPMRAQGEGVILNIGSIAGFVSLVPQPQAAYNASKAAVHMLTKSLASDYAAENIRVNAIAPGYIVTDMTAGGLADPEMAPTWKAMTPMARPGQPEDVACAAVFLCSSASAYITGAVIPVDGGYTSR
ncbi:MULTISPECIES: SDR family NAD(P)-dependent oxidoreductase [Kaistia]|uniref:Glucose 1-dehydrogenase n=1 Tax=Kaistia nematophila TaxID=2994654 RepID=A0A9X3ILU7_9HYPH|nr:glucose 1-dehydrogenase [Kaistia nematophila]MBN9026658.1 glucose 1-dehydrogenase [Hyphomicrobiales bacterium]MBN9058827.1 glucose 1-dehydrogenase [Hyphomicrobiales bacterium]MCX5569901.1 glucose 1-dehydrogenase [Kaistia nematophila]